MLPSLFLFKPNWDPSLPSLLMAFEQQFLRVLTLLLLLSAFHLQRWHSNKFVLRGKRTWCQRIRLWIIWDQQKFTSRQLKIQFMLLFFVTYGRGKVAKCFWVLRMRWPGAQDLEMNTGAWYSVDLRCRLLDSWTYGVDHAWDSWRSGESQVHGTPTLLKSLQAASADAREYLSFAQLKKASCQSEFLKFRDCNPENLFFTLRSPWKRSWKLESCWCLVQV
jgi:hypothetical protein